MSNEKVTIDATLVRETDRALLIDHGSRKNVWVPKTVGDYDEDEKQLTVAYWLARKEGMI